MKPGGFTSWVRRMVGPTPLAQWRCGLLNSSELVLIDPKGQVQVLNAAATNSIEEVLLGRVKSTPHAADLWSTRIPGGEKVDFIKVRRPDNAQVPPFPPIEVCNAAT